MEECYVIDDDSEDEDDRYGMTRFRQDECCNDFVDDV
jgi:hypothetical protein